MQSTTNDTAASTSFQDTLSYITYYFRNGVFSWFKKETLWSLRYFEDFFVQISKLLMSHCSKSKVEMTAKIQKGNIRLTSATSK